MSIVSHMHSSRSNITRPHADWNRHLIAGYFLQVYINCRETFEVAFRCNVRVFNIRGCHIVLTHMHVWPTHFVGEKCCDFEADHENNKNWHPREITQYVYTCLLISLYFASHLQLCEQALCVFSVSYVYTCIRPSLTCGLKCYAVCLCFFEQKSTPISHPSLDLVVFITV